MKITYNYREDVLVISQSKRIGGGSVGRDCELIASFAEKDADAKVWPVVGLSIIGFSYQLPLYQEGRYEAGTDTRLFGDELDPDSEYQVNENGDLVAYWERIVYEGLKGEGDEEEWDLVCVALRRASYYLGDIIAQYPKLRNAK